jgi:hypothetical protein
MEDEARIRSPLYHRSSATPLDSRRRVTAIGPPR